MPFTTVPDACDFILNRESPLAAVAMLHLKPTATRVIVSEAPIPAFALVSQFKSNTSVVAVNVTIVTPSSGVTSLTDSQVVAAGAEPPTVPSLSSPVALGCIWTIEPAPGIVF